jgi:CRP/FNR family transcriptional regulator, cyclic AMP receptor protein
MRADRLVAALLVLGARGGVTAAELSEELEISVRTARRDLEALTQAGVPVYPQRGRGGGWLLVGGVCRESPTLGVCGVIATLRPHRVPPAWQGDHDPNDRRRTSPRGVCMSVRGVFQNATSTRTVPAGTTVFNEGETGEEMFGIISGAIELRASGGATFDLEPDDVFGEMALVDSSPRMATATATQDTELAVIDRRRFLFLITETPTFALQVMGALAQRLRAQET